MKTTKKQLPAGTYNATVVDVKPSKHGFELSFQLNKKDAVQHNFLNHTWNYFLRILK